MKKHVLVFDEREFNDLKTAILLLSIKLPNELQMTSEQKEALQSVKSIAKKISELEPYNGI